MDRATLKNDFKKALTNPYIILLALVVLVSANSLKNDFLNLDDQGLIVQNPSMKLSLKEMPSIFMRPLLGAHGKPSVYYRPLLELLYIFNYKIWGPNPVGFHLVNIMFHFLNAVFTYKIGMLLFNNDKTTSLIAASLFAVHPVGSWPLGGVALNENMYGFFMISSIYFFMHGRKYLSWLIFFLALLSKESAVMLPFVLLPVSIHRDGVRKGITSMIPYAAMIASYFILRLIIMDTILGLDVFQPQLPRILTMTAAFSDYIRLLIIPYPLSPMYPARLYTSAFQSKVLSGIVLIILFCFFIFKLRRNKLMIFLLLSPFILIIPAIIKVNSFPLGIDLTYIGERFLYVPAMIFSLLVSGFFFKLAGSGGRKYVLSGFAGIIIIFTSITIYATKTWENDMTFYTKVTRDAPDSNLSHHYQGEVLLEQARFDEAIREFSAGFEVNPSFYEVVDNNAPKSAGGLIFFREGRLSHTPKKLNHYMPSFANTHFALGRAYLAQGKIDKAIRKFNVTLKLEPNHSDVHYFLAQAFMKKKEFNKASKEFRLFLKLSPPESFLDGDK